MRALGAEISAAGVPLSALSAELRHISIQAHTACDAESSSHRLFHPRDRGRRRPFRPHRTPAYDDRVTDELHAGRWIEIDGVANMRDLGGLPTLDGGRTAWRRLIRSDNLQDLSPEAVEHLVESVGVRDIVDLRSETELHLLGDGPLRVLETLQHHHHSLLPDRAFADRVFDDAADPGREPATRDTGLGSPWKKYDGRRDAEFWAEHYLGYLSERPDSVSAALDVIAGSEGATIVHCAAGKDRTGTVVAMALSVAGVADEVIVEDYVLSDERITRILDRLSTHPVYGEALKSQPVDDQRPKAASMEAILTSVRDGFGGAEGWLRAQGWSVDQVLRLRRHLRED